MLQRLAVVLSAAALTVACGQTDAGITTAVKSKFAADDMVKAYQIDVTTENHVVTLDGRVETSAAKDRAMTLARDTEGVRDVVDRLMVTESAATSGEMDDEDADIDTDADEKAGAAVTDAAITTAVKSKLLGDPKVGGLQIDVDTNGGTVTLTGNVDSKAEADEAVRLARETNGVKNVVNNLKIGG